MAKSKGRRLAEWLRNLDSSGTVSNLTSTGIDDNATSTAITIDASENVGIGTASPDGKLNVFSASAGSVSADADADELVLENSGNVGLSLLTAGTGESGIYFGNPGTNGQKDFYLKFYHESHATTANRRAFTFNTASTERMRIDSSGNVGIGTTNPTRDLQVEGVDPIIATIISSTTGAGIGFKDSTTSADNVNTIRAIGNQLQLRADNNLSILTGGGTERMRIDSSGNVGIGTSSINSSYKLNVEGAVIPILAKSSSTGTSSTYACVATARPLNVVGNGSGYGMNMNNSSGSMTEYGYIGGLIETNTASSHSGALIFAPTSSGTRTERMRIDSSGNLGLNTTAPSSYGGGFVVDDLGINIVTASSSAPGTNKLSWWSDNNGISQNAYISVVSDGATTNTGEMVFYMKNASATLAERMRISSAGRVGIGTNAPISDLTVSNASGGEITLRYTGNSGYTSIQTDAANDLIFGTGVGATERMRIDSNGQTMLAGSTSAFDNTGAVNGLQLHYTTTTGKGVIGTYSSGGSTSLAFRTNSGGAGAATDHMIIDSSGNVGIGTTSPSCRTSVKGTWANGEGIFQVDADSGTQYSGLTFQNNGTVHTYFYDDNTNNHTFLGSVAGKSLVFATNTNGTSNERMRIDSSGNVGINQSAPDAQLTLNPPNYTSTATGGMIKWKNSNNSGHSNIQSYFVSGQGTDLNIGANAYINTSGGWSRWSAGLATSAISCRRDGTIAFITNSSSGNGITRAIIDSSGNLLIGRTSTPSGIQAGSLCIGFDIHHQDTAGNQRLLYDRSANLLGNTGTNGAFNAVAIGTTSPDAPLTIGGVASNAGNAAVSIYRSGNGYGNVRSTSNYGVSFLLAGANDNADELRLTQDNSKNGYLYNEANAPLVFGTNNTERMRIDSSGNVGIGNTSPGSLGTSFNNHFVVSTVNSSGYGNITVQGATGSAGGIDMWGGSIRHAGIYSVNGSNLAFYTNGSNSGTPLTERMRILPTGGLTFNGDTATANALDDYEEGTYTPIYYGSATGNTGTTYTANTGVYTKIGRTVTVWIDITISAQSGNSGTPMISLPFMSGTGYGTDSAGQTRYDMGAFMPWHTSDNFTGTRRPTGWITNNSGVMQMYGYTTAGVGSLTAWTLNTTGRISGKIIYTAAF